MDHPENLTHTWLKESWNFYLDNFTRIAPAVAAYHVLATFPALLIWKHFDNRWYALPYEILIAGPLAIGMNFFFINLSRGRPAEYGDIFRGFSVFFTAMAVSLVYGLLVPSGLLLFIVPGVIWGIMYAFSQYCVTDRKTGIRESFVFSALITYGFKDQLFLLFMLWALLELFTPGIVGARGSILHPVMTLDMKPWAVTISVLKTFIFLPWLDIAMARAYVWLVKNYEAERAGKGTGGPGESA